MRTYIKRLIGRYGIPFEGNGTNIRTVENTAVTDHIKATKERAIEVKCAKGRIHTVNKPKETGYDADIPGNIIGGDYGK